MEFDSAGRVAESWVSDAHFDLLGSRHRPLVFMGLSNLITFVQFFPVQNVGFGRFPPRRAKAAAWQVVNTTGQIGKRVYTFVTGSMLWARTYAGCGQVTDRLNLPNWNFTSSIIDLHVH